MSNTSTMDYLRQAFTENRKGVVDAMLAQPDFDFNTGLLWAAEKEEEGLAKLMHERGAMISAVDENGSTVLHKLFHPYHNNVEQSFVDFLVSAGADVDAQNKWGTTALMACMKNNANLLPLLVKASHNLDLQDNDGKTVLHQAPYYPDMVKLLVEAGANMEVGDAYGKTPLLDAADHYHFRPEGVAVLLEGGANPNACDKNGVTALMASAVNDERLESTKLLLAKGANPGAIDKEGRTALYYALKMDVLQGPAKQTAALFHSLLEAAA